MILILETPLSIAFLTCSSGIPVPPCKTNGRFPTAFLISSSLSKLSPCQSFGYTPWIFPIPAAKKSTPRDAIFLHSSGSANSPAETTPSSSPPIPPTSASTETFFAWHSSTISFVFSIFSSIGKCDPSNIIDVNPASKAFLAPSYEPWSKWSATGTVMFKSLSSPSTILETTLNPPIYFIAPSDTPKITAEFFSWQVSRIAFVHSRLLILNCPIPYPFS